MLGVTFHMSSEDCGNPIVQSIVAESPLQTPYNKWAIGFAQCTKFQMPVAQQLKDLIHRSDKGWQGTLHNENANGKLKATVLRESPSHLTQGVPRSSLEFRTRCFFFVNIQAPPFHWSHVVHFMGEFYVFTMKGEFTCCKYGLMFGFS